MKLIPAMRQSFRSRLFLALALIIFIFIPGSGYFSYIQGCKALEKQMQHYSISTASQIAERIRQFLSQHMDTAKLIKAFIQNNTIDIEDTKALIHYFKLLRGDHSDFVNIYLGDEKGNFTMVPPQKPEIHKIFDPRSRPWYKGAAKAEVAHWTDVYLYASTQNPGITASIPIYDNLGKLQGVCGIDIDLSTFSRFLQNIHFENKGYAYIIENRQGRVIAHPDLVQQTWDPGHIELLSTCLRDLKAANKQFGLSAFEGEYFFTAYADYPGRDWTVGVTLPMTEFLVQIQNIKKTTLSLVLAGMVLCSVLSYLLSLTIVKPLNALRQGIERISDGNLDHKVYPTGLDIADSLAYSFNQMAASLKQSQKALKQTYIELSEKEKLAAIGRMTAGIAHEIKNPLGVILGSAQVVANSERPLSMREEAARFIVDETERLNKTLNSFLAFAKPASPVFKPIDAIQILEEILAATESQFNQSGIDVRKKITDEKGFCLADKDQIRQVFWNIVLNGAQAMPSGGQLTIKAKYIKNANPNSGSKSSNLSTEQERVLEITVSDTGKGICPKDLDRIFDPFVSLRDDGVGLGLSIVRQLLKIHRAKIAVNSKIEQGTTFILTFPCMK
ncbi:MAG: HAMP domain-containing protein [Desulfobacteraceae bacterium]|nr:HAMP domain-containing protein [Desulfobacteraceae bacterium]